jgi:hypothetical protein
MNLIGLKGFSYRFSDRFRAEGFDVLFFVIVVDVDIWTALEVGQTVAAFEGVGVDFLHSAAADHLSQRLAVQECERDNLAVAVRQNDAFHPAAGKGILPHALERGRQLDVFQIVAAVEDKAADFGHRVGNADRADFGVTLEEVVEENG